MRRSSQYSKQGVLPLALKLVAIFIGLFIVSAGFLATKYVNAQQASPFSVSISDNQSATSQSNMSPTQQLKAETKAQLAAAKKQYMEAAAALKKEYAEKASALKQAYTAKAKEIKAISDEKLKQIKLKEKADKEQAKEKKKAEKENKVSSNDKSGVSQETPDSIATTIPDLFIQDIALEKVDGGVAYTVAYANKGGDAKGPFDIRIYLTSGNNGKIMQLNQEPPSISVTNGYTYEVAESGKSLFVTYQKDVFSSLPEGAGLVKGVISSETLAKVDSLLFQVRIDSLKKVPESDDTDNNFYGVDWDTTINKIVSKKTSEKTPWKTLE